MNATTVVRDTETGLVRGNVHNGYTSFSSIPYAAPPVGAGRFEAPRAHAPWTGVRDATAPGPTAPQLPRGDLGPLDVTTYFAPGWTAGEDYLTLDIWAPASVPSFAFRQAPVLVFVHGGAFLAGSSHSPLIDGRGFAERGVIVVTVNYRLGLAGFLDLPGAHPNRGLADVLAALGWVRRNIAAFGGDPANVTLAGHSAGAMLTAAAIASPDARGLFQRAIVQSGSGTGAFSAEQAAIVRESAAKALGVKQSLDAFAALTDEELLAALPALRGADLATTAARDPLQRITPLGVVLDEQPAATVAAGRGQPIDLLVGHNSEEGNLYLLPDGTLDATTSRDVRVAAEYAHSDPLRLLGVYGGRYPEAGPGELRARILGEATFGAGTRALADAHAAAATRRTYAYTFTWRSTALAGRLGATHIVELPFAFNTLTPQLQAEGRLLGAAEAPQEEARRRLADSMHRAWIEFIATGSPGWSPYDPSTRATMFIGEQWSVQNDPYAAERALWTPPSPRTDARWPTPLPSIP
jgi:para-nitrobenzyl esterase